jgi:hypothetical protein
MEKRRGLDFRGNKPRPLMLLRGLVLTAFAAHAEALTYPTASSGFHFRQGGLSRVHRTAPAAVERPHYRLHRTTDGSGTSLQAVQSMAEVVPSRRRSLRGVVYARISAARDMGSSLLADGQWKRLVPVAVLLIACRQCLRIGFAANPFQLGLVVACLVLEIVHLAMPDAPNSR